MRNKISIIIFIVLIGGLIGFLIWQGVKNNQAGPALINFAKCLTEKGAVMYGTDSCEWCQKQKADFKSAWQFIKYANCISDPQRCVTVSIEGTPTWILEGGKRLVGYQTLDKLSRESGCPLPSENK